MQRRRPSRRRGSRTLKRLGSFGGSRRIQVRMTSVNASWVTSTPFWAARSRPWRGATRGRRTAGTQRITKTVIGSAPSETGAPEAAEMTSTVAGGPANETANATAAQMGITESVRGARDATRPFRGTMSPVEAGHGEVDPSPPDATGDLAHPRGRGSTGVALAAAPRLKPRRIPEIRSRMLRTATATRTR